MPRNLEFHIKAGRDISVKPICSRSIHRLVKMYARKAGLDSAPLLQSLNERGRQDIAIVVGPGQWEQLHLEAGSVDKGGVHRAVGSRIIGLTAFDQYWLARRIKHLQR